MLVMFSPVPVADDTGNACTLPDGQKVRLRETFPLSGLYEIGSIVPRWQADWYGQHGLVALSNDGRYAVSINLFGDGAYPHGALSWGIKFYERGVEIKSHDVADLVDYPSLMEFTSSDWHYLWIDDSVFPPKVVSSRFLNLKTSTRATYRFDITTGQIVEEHRFWRYATRVAIFTVVCMGIFASLRMIMRSRVADTTKPTAGLSVNHPSGEAMSEAKKWSYNLRSLFLVTTIVAIFFWMAHVATFVLSIVLALRVTRWARRQVKVMPRTRWHKLRTSTISSLSCLPWVLCYTLSTGPAYFLLGYLELPHDFRQALAQVVYAPFYWLPPAVRVLEFPFLSWYLDAWW